MNNVTVGLLRDDEIEPLQKLAEAIWRVTYKDLISHEQLVYMLDHRHRPALLRQLLARGDRIFAARGGEQLVRFAHAYVTGEGNCKLDKIYVSTDLQRHGIGSLLM